MRTGVLRAVISGFVVLSVLVGAVAEAQAPAPDLVCSLSAWGLRNRVATDGGTVPGTLEPNGMKGLEYALTVKNSGKAKSPTGHDVRYDYVIKIGSTETKTSKPPASFPALDVDQGYTTPRMKVTASGAATFEITATMDANGVVTESDEKNNACKITVTVQ